MTRTSASAATGAPTLLSLGRHRPQRRRWGGQSKQASDWLLLVCVEAGLR